MLPGPLMYCGHYQKSSYHFGQIHLSLNSTEEMEIACHPFSRLVPLMPVFATDIWLADSWPDKSPWPIFQARPVSKVSTTLLRFRQEGGRHPGTSGLGRGCVFEARAAELRTELRLSTKRACSGRQPLQHCRKTAFH